MVRFKRIHSLFNIMFVKILVFVVPVCLFLTMFIPLQQAIGEAYDHLQNNITLNNGNDWFYPGRSKIDAIIDTDAKVPANGYFKIASNCNANVYGHIIGDNMDNYNNHFGCKNKNKNRKIDYDGRVHFDEIVIEYKDYAKDGYLGDFKSKNNEKDDFPICLYVNNSFSQECNYVGWQHSKSITYLDYIEYDQSNHKINIDTTMLGTLKSQYDNFFSSWFSSSADSIEWPDEQNDLAREFYCEPLCCSVYNTNLECIAQKNILFDKKVQENFSEEFEYANTSKYSNCQGYKDNDYVSVPKNTKIKQIVFSMANDRLTSSGVYNSDYQIVNSDSNQNKYWKDNIFYQKIATAKDDSNNWYNIYGCINTCSEEEFYNHYLFGSPYFDNVYIDNIKSDSFKKDHFYIGDWYDENHLNYQDKLQVRLYHPEAPDYNKFKHETHVIDYFEFNKSESNNLFGQSTWDVTIDDECPGNTNSNNKSYVCLFKEDDNVKRAIPINIEYGYQDTKHQNDSTYSTSTNNFNKIEFVSEYSCDTDIIKNLGIDNVHKSVNVEQLYDNRADFDNLTSSSLNTKLGHNEKYYLIAENQYVWIVGHIRPCSDDEYSSHFSCKNKFNNRELVNDGMPYFDEIVIEFKYDNLNEANTIGTFKTKYGTYDAVPMRYFISEQATLEAYRQELCGSRFLGLYIEDIEYDKNDSMATIKWNPGTIDHSFLVSSSAEIYKDYVDSYNDQLSELKNRGFCVSFYDESYNFIKKQNFKGEGLDKGDGWEDSVKFNENKTIKRIVFSEPNNKLKTDGTLRCDYNNIDKKIDEHGYETWKNCLYSENLAWTNVDGVKVNVYGEIDKCEENDFYLHMFMGDLYFDRIIVDVDNIDFKTDSVDIGDEDWQYYNNSNSNDDLKFKLYNQSFVGYNPKNKNDIWNINSTYIEPRIDEFNYSNNGQQWNWTIDDESDYTCLSFCPKPYEYFVSIHNKQGLLCEKEINFGGLDELEYETPYVNNNKFQPKVDIDRICLSGKSLQTINIEESNKAQTEKKYINNVTIDYTDTIQNSGYSKTIWKDTSNNWKNGLSLIGYVNACTNNEWNNHFDENGYIYYDEYKFCYDNNGLLINEANTSKFMDFLNFNTGQFCVENTSDFDPLNSIEDWKKRRSILLRLLSPQCDSNIGTNVHKSLYSVFEINYVAYNPVTNRLYMCDGHDDALDNEFCWESIKYNNKSFLYGSIQANIMDNKNEYLKTKNGTADFVSSNTMKLDNEFKTMNEYISQNSEEYSSRKNIMYENWQWNKKYGIQFEEIKSYIRPEISSIDIKSTGYSQSHVNKYTKSKDRTFIIYSDKELDFFNNSTSGSINSIIHDGKEQIANKYYERYIVKLNLEKLPIQQFYHFNDGQPTYKDTLFTNFQMSTEELKVQRVSYWTKFINNLNDTFRSENDSIIQKTICDFLVNFFLAAGSTNWSYGYSNMGSSFELSSLDFYSSRNKEITNNSTLSIFRYEPTDKKYSNKYCTNYISDDDWGVDGGIKLDSEICTNYWIDLVDNEDTQITYGFANQSKFSAIKNLPDFSKFYKDKDFDGWYDLNGQGPYENNNKVADGNIVTLYACWKHQIQFMVPKLENCNDDWISIYQSDIKHNENYNTKRICIWKIDDN